MVQAAVPPHRRRHPAAAAAATAARGCRSPTSDAASACHEFCTGISFYFIVCVHILLRAHQNIIQLDGTRNFIIGIITVTRKEKHKRLVAIFNFFDVSIGPFWFLTVYW